MTPREERGRAETTAGAWAAAAVVLALGALGFGVATQFELQDMAAKLDRLERSDVTTTTTASSPAGSPLISEAGPTESAPPAETAAVEAAFVALYDGSQPIESRMAYVDDPQGVLAAIQAAGPDFARQISLLRATVSRVTFTSTATATVAYALHIDGGEPLQRLGHARSRDGVWKVSRSTVCADLEIAGARCEA